MSYIAVVEDETSIQKLILYALENKGYTANGFSDGTAFFKSLDNKIPNLVLLDIMLPDMDGIAILKRLRSSPKTEKIPVMMLTAKGTEFDKVTALDLGADDYMTKPFGVMEMLSRVNALLRRLQPGKKEQEVLSLGAVSIDMKRRSVLSNGESITLTLKEFELLYYLMKNTGIVLSRDQIMLVVWGTDFEGETRTVDAHIKSLRQKLGETGESIRTVRGVGYTFDSKEEHR